MSKKLIIILSSVLSLVLLSIIGLIFLILNFGKLFSKNNTVPTYNIEVYKSIFLDTLIGKKTDDNMLLPTSELGTKEIEYSINNKKHKIIINVVDTTPPVSMIGKKYYHIRGTNFTILQDTYCGDNYDSHPKCEVIGDYDLDTLGTYKAKYIATDSSGNKFEKDFEIEVVEKSKEKMVYMSFDDVKKRVGDNKLLIDVSKWEEDIDWKQVKESGIDYAFIRLGTQKYSTKELLMDDYFEKNYKKAKENGIKIGVYFFTYADSKKEVEEHAKFVLNAIKDKEIDLGVVYDWECWELFNGMKISMHTLNEIKDTFMKKIKDAGYRPILYSSKYYLENVWTIKDEAVWLAHYTETTDYKGKYILWQFASNALVPGIDTDVDVNVYYE